MYISKSNTPHFIYDCQLHYVLKDLMALVKPLLCILINIISVEQKLKSNKFV